MSRVCSSAGPDAEAEASEAGRRLRIRPAGSRHGDAFTSAEESQSFRRQLNRLTVASGVLQAVPQTRSQAADAKLAYSKGQTQILSFQLINQMHLFTLGIFNIQHLD